MKCGWGEVWVGKELEGSKISPRRVVGKKRRLSQREGVRRELGCVGEARAFAVREGWRGGGHISGRCEGEAQNHSQPEHSLHGPLEMSKS